MKIWREIVKENVSLVGRQNGMNEKWQIKVRLLGRKAGWIEGRKVNS